MFPTLKLKNNADAGYQGPIKNRAFERCRSTAPNVHRAMDQISMQLEFLLITILLLEYLVLFLLNVMLR